MYNESYQFITATTQHKHADVINAETRATAEASPAWTQLTAHAAKNLRQIRCCEYHRDSLSTVVNVLVLYSSTTSTSSKYNNYLVMNVRIYKTQNANHMHTTT